MKHSLEIKLKEEKAQTFWERLVAWLREDAHSASQSVQQVPKTGTNTDILLSQAEKLKLKAAVESPLLERTSDSTMIRRENASQEGSLII